MKKFYFCSLICVLSISLFTACGSTKPDYEKDVVAVLSFTDEIKATDIEDTKAYGQAIETSLSKLDMQTKEGKKLKKDFAKMGEIMTSMSDAMDNNEFDEVENQSEELDKLKVKIQEDSEKLGKAAEKTGVSKQILEVIGQ